MFLIGLGALLVLGGILYTARTAIWRGPLSGPDSSRRPVRGTLGSRAARWCPQTWQAQCPSSSAPPHGRCLAAPAHIAEHLTIEGRKFLSVHAKWNGRYDERGVKLQHGPVQFIWAMRALRRLHGAGAAG